jgi:MOSC domain-containing protein YiiM
MARVVSIHLVSERDGPATALDVAQFVADYGLTGDWRSRKGRGRQITIVEVETLEHVAARLSMEAVPSGASRRQVVVRGVDLNATLGKQLRMGDVLVSVEAPCDPCSKMETSIGPGARQAMLDRGGVCGRVLEGGAIRPDDLVIVVEENANGYSDALLTEQRSE